MIITEPREWRRVTEELDAVGARRVYVVGCGQCATVAGTGGEEAIREAAALLHAQGREVVGTSIGDVACHAGGTRLEFRKHASELAGADAVLVLSCGAGVQTVADAVVVPVVPGLESKFLGNVVRHGVFEERCQMCGECVLGRTAGICPVTTCPKGLLNGPCGGMWDGMCEVLADRRCTHVRIGERLASQGRPPVGELAAKDHSAKHKPGSVDLRAGRREARKGRGR